jgi:hypothetical protein
VGRQVGTLAQHPDVAFGLASGQTGQPGDCLDGWIDIPAVIVAILIQGDKHQLLLSADVLEREYIPKDAESCRHGAISSRAIQRLTRSTVDRRTGRPARMRDTR